MAGGRTAKVLIVDDHALFRTGLSVTLTREIDLEVIGEAGSASEALELARRVEIDVAVVDVLMPLISGITLSIELHDIQPRCRVLGLSVIDDPGVIADMLRARASGFALKTQPIDEVIDAIRQVLHDIRYLPPGVSHDAVDTELGSVGCQPLACLTHREREIFELLIRGHSNNEIAAQLFIARRTVETHRQRIVKKLSAHSIVQMQRIAARYGGLET
jgi:DNA-binding NarL/FixJ family response regulator